MKQKQSNKLSMPPVFSLIVAGLLLQSFCAVQGDIVYLKDGGSIEGTLTRQGDKIRVEFRTGSIEIGQEDVERIEVRALPQRIFSDQLLKAGDNADACVKLAQWALAKDMSREYIQGLRRALQIDGQHKLARQLLRDFQHRVKYLPENHDAADKLIRDMGPDFQVLRTHHYRICYSSSDIFADICGETLEKVYDQFVYFFTNRQFDPVPITDRLEVVLFDTKEQYIAFATKVKSEFKNSAGFYDSETKRCYFYDALNTGDFLQQRHQLYDVIDETNKMRKQIRQNHDQQGYVWVDPEGNEQPISRAQAIDKLDRRKVDIDHRLDELHLHYRESNITTSVHEAVHQLAWQSSIQSHLHETPLWLSEGLATYFEAANEGQWYGPGEIHHRRLSLFLVDNDSDGYVSLDELIASDDLFNLDQSRAGTAYAAAWSLFYYLSQQHHEAFFDYVYDLSVEVSRKPYSKAERIRRFENYFGDRNILENQWRYTMESLAR